MIEPAFKNMEDIHWASQQVEEALLNMIKDERGQWLLSAEHQQQNNEYALTGVYTDKVVSIKIDRTFVDQDGTRWIIDYKTSRHEEEDVDAFLDQQQDMYRKYSSRVMQEQLPNVTENSWKNTGH